MAKNRATQSSINDTDDKISIATYGIGNKLDNDSKALSNIVKQSTIELSKQYARRLGDTPVNGLSHMGIGELFLKDNNTRKDKKDDKTAMDMMTADDFRSVMMADNNSAIGLLSAENNRLINYANYTSIVENIPECDLALKAFKTNILSPDDYTKTIFTVQYNDPSDAQECSRVTKQLKSQLDKYEIEDLSEKIIGQALTLGDCFVSVLPYNEEIGKILAENPSGTLNESIGNSNYELLDENFHITSGTYASTLNEDAINECIYNNEEQKILTEAFGENASSALANLINNNINIKPITNMLLERADADNDVTFDKTIVYGTTEKEYKDKKHKSKKPILTNINGAAITMLDPSRVIELKVNNIIYGYYYIQPGDDRLNSNSNNIVDYKPTNGANSSVGGNAMNPNMLNGPTTNGTFKNISSVESNPISQNLNISDEKLSILTNVVMRTIGKKLNKKFIEKNKQLKDLIYSLLRQKYIIEKGIDIMFFLPDEIVHFECESIFKNIVFFAKIYLATLTNIVIIKMGRGHDKRVVYINAGPDNNHEQAVMKVIQDMKTREFKMSNLGSIASIVRLNPGAFDDIFIPVNANGEHPVDIETIQGMDQEINNEFIDFLRKSMIQGTGISPSLLLTVDNQNVEFARQLASQDANFSRLIIEKQKKFTKGFTKLMRLIYYYETRFTADSKIENKVVDYDKILVKFPSPKSLGIGSLLELFTQVDQLSEGIVKMYIPERSDQSQIDEANKFKAVVVKHYLPQLEWEDFDELYKNFQQQYKAEVIVERTNKKRKPDDPNSSMY